MLIVTILSSLVFMMRRVDYVTINTTAAIPTTFLAAYTTAVSTTWNTPQGYNIHHRRLMDVVRA